MDDYTLFPEPSREEVKTTRQKNFNAKQISLAKTVGENAATIGCILILIMFVGYIWADMRIQLSWQRVLCDAAASIISFILVEDLMSKSGIKCGKLYPEYISAHEDYLQLKDEVIALGVTEMDAFCEEMVEREYDIYLRRRCRELKIDYDDYKARLHDMPADELVKVISPDKVASVAMLNQIKRIDLTKEILLTDGAGERYERGGVSIGALDYVKKSTKGWLNITLTVVSCVISAGIVFTANEGASWGLVMYTLLKISLLCWRMFKGFSTGAKAYNTYEVKSLQDKGLYLNLYKEYKQNLLNVAFLEEQKNDGTDHGQGSIDQSRAGGDTE
jgi:hypothetical protein